MQQCSTDTICKLLSFLFPMKYFSTFYLAMILDNGFESMPNFGLMQPTLLAVGKG